jgi:hypothetical protein
VDGDVTDLLEGHWVRVTEWIDENGDPTIAITHSPLLTPWQIIGMLTAATDYHRELTKNIFFANGWETDEYADDDDMEDEA